MKNNYDLIGKKFGSLTVVEKMQDRDKFGCIVWRCSCRCGNESFPTTHSLVSGHSTSCGCKFRDISGTRSGKLVAISFAGKKNGRSLWLCKCDCGGEKIVLGSHITTNRRTHCGCVKPNFKHGLSNDKMHYTWNAMKQRCSNPNNSDYHNYGGRGIKVCDRWLVFSNFYNDMHGAYIEHIEAHGSKNASIDRIDSNGNYEPSNCRWATIETQSYNKRDSIRIEYEGNLITTKELSCITGLPLSTIYSRYEKGERGSVLTRPRGVRKNIKD